MRRVRIDPPTVAEALYAAAGMTPSSVEQIAIAAELMRLPVEQVKAEARRIAKSVNGGSANGGFPVVVLRKGHRRARSPAPVSGGTTY
jgi:hypothetical protein